MRNRYILSHNGNEQEVTPEKGVTLSLKRPEKDQRFFTVSIKGGMVVLKQFFAFVADIENGSDRCLPITLTIKRRIDDVVVYTGVTYADSIEYDFDACEANITVETQGDYSDFIAKWKEPVNILAGTSKVGAYSNYQIHGFSTIETTEDVQTLSLGFPGNQTFPNSGWPDPFDGWVMTYDSVKVIEDPLNIIARRTTRWARETSATGPNSFDGGGWYNNGSTWVRRTPSILTQDSTTTLTFGITPGEWFYDEYERVYDWLPTTAVLFANGVTLANVIAKILSGSGIALTVKSCFFEINPDGSEPANDAYARTYPNLVVYQRTDIKRPEASQPATVCKLSLNALAEMLWLKYQVQVVVQGTDLRIEHYSYFDADNGLDLTVVAPSALAGKRKYTYDRAEIPVGEYWAEESETACLTEFQRWQFSYKVPTGLEIPTNCAPGYVDEKGYTVSGNVSDIQSVHAQPDFFQDEGICIVDTVFHSGNRYLYCSSVFNRSQSQKDLQVLMYYNRYLPYGVYIVPLSAEYYYFLSVRRSKKQTPITFKIADWENFNPIQLVKTQFGWGEITEAEYDLESAFITVKTSHT
jgi:hypothetical protein